MGSVRLGAVGYLNARPLVWGLETSSQFDLRFDVPSRCADLLHDRAIDIGLIPSIEYLRGDDYLAVPDLAIASRGPVASVLLFSKREPPDIRTIAMDTSSRTSAALVRILCAHHFRISPAFEPHEPSLEPMLSRSDAALIIGDRALFVGPEHERTPVRELEWSGGRVTVFDLGDAWQAMTRLPFVWAFWAGRPGAVTPGHVDALRRARDEGVRQAEEIARRYRPDSRNRQVLAARYLRDNIQYRFGAEERAGVELFYRYASEMKLVSGRGSLRFYGG